MNPERLQQILSRAAEKRILVIGDLMLDEFVWGKVGRISPEAPVPVVEVVRESFYPGGAANVARNLREFVEHVSVVGLLGKDRGGEKLRELLRDEKIETRDAIEDAEFPTIVKTRIVARQQQVVRVDREKIRALSAEQIARVVEQVSARLQDFDAVIFEDYGKGFLNSELVSKICDAAKAAGKIVTVDPNPKNPIAWKNVTAIKPNRSEAFAAANIPLIDPPDEKSLEKVGAALLEKWDARQLLITLGEQGMMLFQRDEKPHHTPTKARQVFDVSGAGDTAIALYTLALCAEATPIEAAEIANHGSAVVVGKLGTATVTRAELTASFHDDGVA